MIINNYSFFSRRKNNIIKILNLTEDSQNASSYFSNNSSFKDFLSYKYKYHSQHKKNIKLYLNSFHKNFLQNSHDKSNLSNKSTAVKTIMKNKSYMNKTFSNEINIKTNHKLFKNEGMNFLLKKNYGRLYLFNDSLKKITHMKYINNILNEEMIHQKKENFYKDEIKLTEKCLHSSKNLLNIFKDEYDKNCSHIKEILSIEKNKNEILKFKEINLKNNISNLKQKINKVKNILINYIEIKIFLIYIKNKQNNCLKFKNIKDQILLKNEKSKIKLINNLEDEINQKNYNLMNNSPFLKNKSSNLAMKNNKYLKLLTKKISKPIQKVKTNSKINNDSNINQTINEPIFDNVENFMEQFHNIEMKVIKKLNILNNVKSKIFLLKKELKDVMKINLQNEKYKNFEKEIFFAQNNLHILKQKFNHLNNHFNSLKKDDVQIFYNNENMKNKIILIYNLIKENFSINENYKNNDENILEKLKIIEKYIYKLLKNNEELKNNYPNEYNELIKKLKNKKLIEQIKKNKNEEKMRQLKIINKKIIESNKIYFLPKKKIKEKFNLKNKKKIVLKEKIDNESFNDNLFY